MKSDPITFVEASAPGRLDVMGGIADYSGSLVLQLPIRERTTVKIKLRTDYECTIKSATKEGESFEAFIDFRRLLKNGEIDYQFAQKQFGRNKSDAWIAYVLGCVLVLQKERQIQFKGADFVIHSEVPLGKGVSSSAALEVATMTALGITFGLSFSGTELPILAQRAENLVVGAPCGLMDQLTCFFGEPLKLLPILCQPDKVMLPLPVPADVFFLGVDSGIRHSVSGASYTDVRCAAFMGYTLIARLAGAVDKAVLDAIESNNSSQLPFGGYLCNISVGEFENKFKPQLPESMSGEDFLEHYPGTIDQVTTVNKSTLYSIGNCTSHPVYEHARVKEFMQQLSSLQSEIGDSRKMKLQRMGELMSESHASYSRCGLGSDRTDEIVHWAKDKKDSGIYGAKITGGGNGGTVCILAAGQQGKDSVLALHHQLEMKYSTRLALFET